MDFKVQKLNNKALQITECTSGIKTMSTWPLAIVAYIVMYPLCRPMSFTIPTPLYALLACNNPIYQASQNSERHSKKIQSNTGQL
jgi:hypothetical protein